MNTKTDKFLVVLALVLTAHALHAGSATWNVNPTSNDWNTAANWTPATIPSHKTDLATFGTSSTVDVICGDAPGGAGGDTIVGGIIFAPDASSYTVTITPVFDIGGYPSILEIYGAGLTNNSGRLQSFVTANSGTSIESARIYFNKSSSAGDNIMYTNQGGGSSTGDGVYGGFTSIEDSATAGTATFINNGGTVSGSEGGVTLLLFSSSAESATLINNPGAASGAAAGYSVVQTSGNIGNSTFICNPATIAGAEGGWVE